MARARNIKPGFFSNEDLAECSPWARLCFAGLWTLADREGRLEDRPKRIKGELFRFDSVDAELLLQELARFKFIVRYEIDGDHFIEIPEFSTHQAPHYSEKPSVIKPPPLPESWPHDGGRTPGVIQESSRSPPGVGGPLRGGRNPLNPDCLNPDSGFLDPERGEERARPPEAEAENPENPPDPPDPTGHQPTPGGAACRAIKAAGILDVNPSHPGLQRLLTAGVTAGELADAALVLVGKGKPRFAYLLSAVEGQRLDAAAKAAVPAGAASPVTVPSNAADLTSEYLRQQANRGATKPPPEVLAALRRIGR